MINDGVIIPKLKGTITVSFDTNPGMQVIKQKSEELVQALGKHSTVTKRL
jgi:hypothetical protein